METSTSFQGNHMEHTVVFHELHDAALAHYFHEHNTLLLNRGAEVGVRYGENAIKLLNRFPDLTLLAVDPYEPYIDLNNEEYTKERQAAIEQAADKNFEPFIGRCLQLRMTSEQAAGFVWYGMIDFAFIDANHAYESVQKDIRAWWPMVRYGGVLCGHDYNCPDVRRAVQEFAERQQLEIVHYTVPAAVWIIAKPAIEAKVGPE